MEKECIKLYVINIMPTDTGLNKNIIKNYGVLFNECCILFIILMQEVQE